MIEFLIVIALVILVTRAIERGRYYRRLRRLRGWRPEASLTALWRGENRLMGALLIVAAIMSFVGMMAITALAMGGWR
ncbi:hypothetical protein [Nitrospira calida]|jgi:hypothetical protein